MYSGLIYTKLSNFGRKCKHSIKGGESGDPGDAVVARSSEDERTEGNEGEEEHEGAEEALSAGAAASEEEGVDQFLQEIEEEDGESSEFGLDFVGPQEELVEDDGALLEQQVSQVAELGKIYGILRIVLCHIRCRAD